MELCLEIFSKVFGKGVQVKQDMLYSDWNSKKVVLRSIQVCNSSEQTFSDTIDTPTYRYLTEDQNPKPAARTPPSIIIEELSPLVVLFSSKNLKTNHNK